MSATDLSDFLSQQAKTLGLSATNVSTQAGISRQTWYRLINADIKHIRLETLACVADVLQVSLVDLSHLYIKKQKLREEAFISKVHVYAAEPFIKNSPPVDILINEDEVFEKQWEIVNASSTYWINRRLVCTDERFRVRLKNQKVDLCTGRHYGGLKPEQHTINIPLTAPNEKVTLSILFRSPKEPGTVISFWKMVNAQGDDCFPEHMGLSCQVTVVENAVGFIQETNEGAHYATT